MWQSENASDSEESAQDTPERRVDASSLMPGITFPALEEEPYEVDYAFAVVKYRILEDPEVLWAFRASKPASDQSLEELLGALRVQVLLVERSLMRTWEDGA